MLHLAGTRAYQKYVPDDESTGTIARPQMHYESMTVQMVYDPSGLYRTWLGVFFSWWEFCYTAVLGNWTEGARFVVTGANGERRYLEIRDRRVVEVLTGERLFLNKGAQEWEYSRAAAKLWSTLRLVSSDKAH